MPDAGTIAVVSVVTTGFVGIVGPSVNAIAAARQSRRHRDADEARRRDELTRADRAERLQRYAQLMHSATRVTGTLVEIGIHPPVPDDEERQKLQDGFQVQLDRAYSELFEPASLVRLTAPTDVAAGAEAMLAALREAQTAWRGEVHSVTGETRRQMWSRIEGDFADGRDAFVAAARAEEARVASPTQRETHGWKWWRKPKGLAGPTF